MDQLSHLFSRHEARGETLAHVKAALGVTVALLVVGGLAAWTGLPLLLAPFGASALLLFSQPQSPYSQPANVLGGYLCGVGISMVVLAFAPNSWWIATIAVGLTTLAMLMFRVTHAPGGAIPLVAFSSHLQPTTLLFVVIAGALCLIGLAFLHHRMPPKLVYPRRSAAVLPPSGS